MRQYKFDPHTIALRLHTQYGDQALDILKQMTFSPERRGRAERLAIYEETAAIIRDMQKKDDPGTRINTTA